MPFTVQGNTIKFDSNIEDVKLIYRTLHRHLADNLDLMDCEFFDALQSALQEKAQAEGVDIGHHGAWDLWLGNLDSVPCEERMKNRKQL